MLVITTRPELEVLIYSALDDARRTSVTFADSLEGVTPAQHALVVIDLASFIHHRISDDIRLWRKKHPQLAWVYLVPLLAPQEEVQLLGGLFPLGPARIVTRPELTNRGVWMELASRRSLAVWRRLQDRLEESVPGTVIQQADVWPLLRQAADTTTIQEYCRRNRLVPLTLWRRLTKAQQRAPKELLTAFRVLWYVALIEEGLSSPQIEHYLHANREQLQRMGRPLGITSGCLNRLQLESTIGIFGQHLLRTEHGGVLRPSILPPLLAIGHLLRCT